MYIYIYIFVIYNNSWMQFHWVQLHWKYWFNLLSKKKQRCGVKKAKDYCRNNKDKLREQARDKYRNLSEEKNKKREYGKNRHHKMSEDKKTRLKEYQKNYSGAKKSQYIIIK